MYLYEFGPSPYMTFTGWYDWEKEQHPFRYFRWLGGTGGEVHVFPVSLQSLRVTAAGQVPSLPADQTPCGVDVGVGHRVLATLRPGPFEQTWVVGREAIQDTTLRIWWRPRRFFRPVDVGETPDPRQIGCLRIFSLRVEPLPAR